MTKTLQDKDIERKLHKLSHEINEKKVGLREKDKNILRSNIEEYAAMRPVSDEENTQPKRIKWSRKMRENVVALLRGSVAGVLAAVFIGGGVAYAAANALPGQALYSVKVNLNEEVMSLMARTPEAEARLQAKLAERRIREVEVLAAKGNLSLKEQKQLRFRFQKHAQASEESLEKIKGKDRKEIIADIQSEFEAALAAHAELLKTIAQDHDVPSSVEKVVSPEKKQGEQGEQGDIDTGENPQEQDGKEAGKEEAGINNSNASTTATTTSATSTQATSTGESKKPNLNASTTQRQKQKEGIAVKLSTTSSSTEQEKDTTGSSTGVSENKNAQSRAASTKSMEETLSEQGEKQLDAVISWINKKQKEISEDRERVEISMWTEVASRVEVLTKKAKGLAQKEIEMASTLFDKNENKVNIRIQDEIVDLIGDANMTFDSAQEYSEEKEYASAYREYRDAMRKALKAQILIKTSAKLSSYINIEGFDDEKLEMSLKDNVGTGDDEKESETSAENANISTNTTTGAKTNTTTSKVIVNATATESRKEGVFFENDQSDKAE